MPTWLLVLLFAFGLWPLLAVAWIYNRLVTLQNRYRNAFSQIDVQLKRRHDLIPNLVASTRGYLEHERALLEAVTTARARARRALGQAAIAPGEAAAMGALGGAEGRLAGSLAQLFGVVERYPELKGDRTVADLMEALSTTENRIAFARQAYNDAVMRYNEARERFPALLIAEPLGFGEAAYLRLEAGERNPSALTLNPPQR